MNKTKKFRSLLHRHRYLWENSNRMPTGQPDDPYEATGDALIHHLARHGPVEDLDMLLLSGADVNLRGEAKWTPLHWTVFTRNIPALILLLRAGADPLVKDIWGRTALEAAQSKGEKEAADLLAEAVQQRNTDNPSPLPAKNSIPHT